MNTEQLKTAEEILKSKAPAFILFNYNVKDNTSHSDVLEAMQDFASQESKRAVDEFKDDLRRKIKEAQGGISNISMSSRAIIEDIVLKEINR